MSNKGKTGSATKSRRRRNRLDGPPALPPKPNLSPVQRLNLKRNQLRSALPNQIQNLVSANKNTRDILRVDSQQANRGFDAAIWRDNDGRTLYLNNKDNHGAINGDDRVTFANIRQMADQASPDVVKPARKIPEKIIVQTANGADARLAAKRMIQKTLDDSGKRYILKDGEATPLDNGQVALSFSVTAMADPKRIDNPDSFKIRMGGPPKKDITIKDALIRSRSDRYKEVLSALETYKKRIEEIDREVFDIEDTAERTQVPGQRYNELNQLADKLINAAQDYIDNSGTVPLIRGRQRAKDSKVAVVASLQQQVRDAKQELFKGELDAIRQRRILELNPLRENQIIPGTSEVLGRGAHGDVSAVSIKLEDGSVSRFAVKADNKAWEGASAASGIPRENPQQSDRAVAVSRINDAFHLDSVPRTEYIQLSDDNGRPRQGQAMGKVEGFVGHKKVPDGNPISADLARRTDPNFVIEVNGQWFNAVYRVANVDETMGIVQKGMSDLQLLDVIIGHVDRNPGNFVFETDHNDPGLIIGVKGIDNDDTLAHGWEEQTFTNFLPPSKTPGVPPVIDVETAVKILESGSQHIDRIMANFTQAERDAVKDRLSMVQREIRSRVANNGLASNKGRAQLAADLNKLATLAEIPDPNNIQFRPWGAATSGDHTNQNSYLGQFTQNKVNNGTYPGPAINRGLY